MEINNILIASDFSKHSDYSLSRAVTLAEQHKAILHFLHILIQPRIGNFSQFSIEELEQDYLAQKKKIEKKILKCIKKYSHNIETYVSVLAGRAADEIVRYAKENKCNMIIAGAHGEYYIKDYILGTTSSSMISHSDVPILLVKKEPSFAYNRIIIATDFSEVSKNAIEFTFKCFPNATFQLLHIIDIYFTKLLLRYEQEDTKDITHRLDDFLGKCNVDQTKFQKKIMGGYIADTIVIQSEKWQADLISFGAQGNSKLQYLLTGSVAKRLLQLCTTDMLVVPPKQK
ncbi:universal stress protein family [Legionella sainthelensi]|uniref:universal stress protein n=1 Tax=Legionella sainthelensi TaxID=28087 RepID=UPI000E20C02A|nr:universal stress protein [Legionella sainthelensi]VEB38342.1 universal stress protein family [Legionella sainthelensi]